MTQQVKVLTAKTDIPSLGPMWSFKLSSEVSTHPVAQKIRVLASGAHILNLEPYRED